jgi:hypothetical protein
VQLASRRLPVARDVGFIVKRGADRFPLESPFAPMRKRLGPPDSGGAFAVGTLTPEVIPTWLAGVVTDMRGRPLRNAVLELFMHAGCGTIGGDAGEVEDPTRPKLEEWPRKVETDREGRFSVTGSKDVMGRRFAFRLADRAGRVHHQPDGWIIGPALDLRLVAEDEGAVWVEIDGGISSLADRRIDLAYEARREPGEGRLPDCPVIVVRDYAKADPEIEDEERRAKSACASMLLVPGRWYVTMSVYGHPAIVSRGQIDVVPSSGFDAETPRFRLEVVQAVPRETEVAQEWLHRATVRVLSDGQAVPRFTVRMRASPDDDWSSCDDDGSVALVDFNDDHVEISVEAPGFFPVETRVREGTTTIALRAAPETLVHVHVPPFPAGVQADVDWWVEVSGGRDRVAKPSNFYLILVHPGVHEVKLIGGGLVYATRQIEIGSGHPVTVDLAVDPESEGMRARTTGIGW